MKRKISCFKIKCFFMVFVIAFLTQSCVSMVHHEKMKLTNKKDAPVILKLQNYGDSDEVLFKQSENLVKGHLFKNHGDEYGYYVLKYKTTQTNVSLGPVAGMFFFLLPLGLPTQVSHIFLEAKLYIFDSQGGLVREYEEYDNILQTAGMYYGHRPTKKVAKKYSKMYEGIFEFAKLQADKINKALLKSGTITAKNEKIAKANIESFFRERNESYAKIIEFNKRPKIDLNQYNAHFISLSKYRYTFSEIEERIEKGHSDINFDTTKLNNGMEIGTYYCTVDSNLKIKMVLGMLTIFNGEDTIAAGSFSISGNKFIVSFYAGSGYIGKKLVYVMDDSKNFHLEGSNEYWMHESIY